MIFRLSHKLNTKIKAGTLNVMPLDENPYADWSYHLFTANRTQYIIMSNTKSLYSCLMVGKGITDHSRFIESALSAIGGFMKDDGQSFVYQRFIAPASGTVSFANESSRPRNAAMPISQYEIDSFHSFATGVLTNGDRNQSMEDLVERWRSQREEMETLASIQRGVEDADAGRVNSLDEVDANIRQKLGFPVRSK